MHPEATEALTECAHSFAGNDRKMLPSTLTMKKTLKSRLNRSRTEHRRQTRDERTENLLQTTEQRCDLTGTDGVYAIDSLGDSQGDRRRRRRRGRGIRNGG